MNKNMKKGILVLVFLLAIGFAAVATNLIINGSASLGFVSSDFDIYFSEAQAETGGTASINQTTRKTITYSTKTLVNVGDEAVLDYVVTNNSTMYDANGTITFTLDQGADEYVTITKTGFTDNQTSVVPAKSSIPGRVKIILKKRSIEPLTFSFTLTINFEPVGVSGTSDGNGGLTNPVDPTCVSDGWYLLTCSCDNHGIAWQDGPYLDSQGNAMNSSRIRDPEYPPANTYICGCANGTTGYVVNTGQIEGTICGVTNVSHDNLVTKLLAKGDDLPQTYGYDVNYSVTVNNTVRGTEVSTPLNNWKLLYTDGEYAYLITSSFVGNNIVVGEPARTNLDAGQDYPGDEWIDPGDNNSYFVDGSRVATEYYGDSAPIVYNTLNNNSYWTQLLNDKSDLAWGGAPLDILIGSWNSKYPTQQISAQSFDDRTGFRDGPANDTLYFPLTVATDNNHADLHKAYVVGKSADFMYVLTNSMYVYEFGSPWYYKGVSEDTNWCNSLRPVIRLKADVDGTIDDEHHTITLN
jgi:hypothetical protein